MMPLIKSPSLTPAKLAANRSNARKSTGPRTARGKSRVRLNSLKTGGRSAIFENFFVAIHDPFCPVEETVRRLLKPGEAEHPVFAWWIDWAVKDEIFR